MKVFFTSNPSSLILQALFAVLALLLLIMPAPAQEAQNGAAASSRFEAKVRAVDSVTLMAGQTPIRLWGAEKISGHGAAFDLKARTALDNVTGQSKVVCEIKTRDSVAVSAQCTNMQDQDLSLYMIQQGYATVDRGAVYGSIFEDAYIQAEMQAQGRGLGVWADSVAGKAQAEGGFAFGIGVALFVGLAAAFGVLSVIIMRGFQKVIDAQNQNVEMMSQERQLRDKERGIVAIMLDSELKANKAKIEAYLVVYEEMLRGLREPDRAPKYKKAGDIIQKQPALSRSVFDRNTDKLEMLGAQLSSQLVHFYARIKSSPEYINLEPSTPAEEAIALLEQVLTSARRLNDLAGRLLEAFANSGVISEDFQE